MNGVPFQRPRNFCVVAIRALTYHFDSLREPLAISCQHIDAPFLPMSPFSSESTMALRNHEFSLTGARFPETLFASNVLIKIEVHPEV